MFNCLSKENRDGNGEADEHGIEEIGHDTHGADTCQTAGHK